MEIPVTNGGGILAFQLNKCILGCVSFALIDEGFVRRRDSPNPVQSLTHDSAIALKYFLDVYLVHLEGVEVPDKDAGVDRVRVLRARLISDFAKIHFSSL